MVCSNMSWINRPGKCNWGGGNNATVKVEDDTDDEAEIITVKVEDDTDNEADKEADTINEA